MESYRRTRMGTDSTRRVPRTTGNVINKSSSFEEATSSTRRVGDESHIYDADVPPDWCLGSVAFGGYLSSLLTCTVEKHGQEELQSGELPAQAGKADPVLHSCDLSFVEGVTPGPVEIHIRELPSNKHVLSYEASLRQYQRRHSRSRLGSESTTSSGTSSASSSAGSSPDTQPSLQQYFQQKRPRQQRLTLCAVATITLMLNDQSLRPSLHMSPLYTIQRQISRTLMFPQSSPQSFYRAPQLDTRIGSCRFKPHFQSRLHHSTSSSSRNGFNLNANHARSAVSARNPSSRTSCHPHQPTVGGEKSVFDVWWKFHEPITAQHFGLLSDMVGPMLMNFDNKISGKGDGGKDKAENWVRTKDVKFEVVRPAPALDLPHLERDLIEREDDNNNIKNVNHDRERSWEWILCHIERTTADPSAADIDVDDGHMNADERERTHVSDKTIYLDITYADRWGNVICIARHECVSI